MKKLLFTILAIVGVFIIGKIYYFDDSARPNDNSVESYQKIILPTSVGTESGADETSSVARAATNQTTYALSVSAITLTDSIVEFSVETNIPLPIEVMASVSLQGQRPKDVYIGFSQKVMLRTPKQTFVLNTSSQSLPDAEYFAEVTFYPRWGAKNGTSEAQSINTIISDVVELHLIGTGEALHSVTSRNEMQSWVIDNVVIGTKWNREIFENKLGSFERLEAELNLQDVYYFPKSDMTIIVNSAKGTVAIWRMGRANR